MRFEALSGVDTDGNAVPEPASGDQRRSTEPAAPKPVTLTAYDPLETVGHE
jgi:hypothetical protein